MDNHAWCSGGPKRIAPLLVGPVGMELAGVAAAILAAPQGPGLFGGTGASRKRFAVGLSSAELEVRRIGLSAEMDAVRGEQVDRGYRQLRVVILSSSLLLSHSFSRTVLLSSIFFITSSLMLRT